MLEKRNAQPADDRSRLSGQIQKHVIESKEFRSAKVVGAYSTFGSEVGTEMIIEQARALGKKIALPSVEGHTIAFYELSSNKYLVKGRFGIMEPLPYSPVERMDLMVVPGVAFDRRGYRLGYGQGYYDKFLAGKSVFSIGLAYSFQMLESLPRGEYDKKLDAIATENGIHHA